jgi:hypothetical protein
LTSGIIAIGDGKRLSDTTDIHKEGGISGGDGKDICDLRNLGTGEFNASDIAHRTGQTNHEISGSIEILIGEPTINGNAGFAESRRDSGHLSITAT